MRAIMYKLSERLPEGKGKRTTFAEQYWSGKPLNKICGRRYWELVSEDSDVYDFPSGATLADVFKWAATTDYAAVFVNGQLMPVARPLSDRGKRELHRILALYEQGNKNWVKPDPKESK